jgi:hypothetical protein
VNAENEVQDQRTHVDRLQPTRAYSDLWSRRAPSDGRKREGLLLPLGLSRCPPHPTPR